MKKSIKASLSLSVNAIVVFVLAFAMLGVGLVFVNMLRDRFLGTAGETIDLNDLENPPTSTNALTVKSKVTFKKNKKLELDIGYYNTGNSEAATAKIGIQRCLNENGSDMTLASGAVGLNGNYITLVSPSQKVPASEGVGYKIILKEKEDATSLNLPIGLYVCRMIVYNGDMDNTLTLVPGTGTLPLPEYVDILHEDDILESKEFFMEVVS